MTDAELIESLSDADVLLLSNCSLFKGSDRDVPQAQAVMRGIHRYRSRGMQLRRISPLGHLENSWPEVAKRRVEFVDGKPVTSS
jgi:hypothetical protein